MRAILIFFTTVLLLTIEIKCYCSSSPQQCYLTSPCSGCECNTYLSYDRKYRTDCYSSRCCSCILGYYFNQTDRKCYDLSANCGKDDNNNTLYWFYQNNTCVLDCPANSSASLKDYYSNKCINGCPNTTLTDFNIRVCVKICSQGLFDPKNVDRYCYRQCLPGTFGDPINRICIKKALDCPWDQFYGEQTYAQNTTRLCVNKCPDMSYAHPEIKYCVKRCFGAYMYKNELLNTCIKEKFDYFAQLQMLIKDKKQRDLRQKEMAKQKELQKEKNQTKQNSTVIEKPVVEQKQQTFAQQASSKISFQVLLSVISIIFSSIAIIMVCFIFGYYHCYIKSILERRSWTTMRENSDTIKVLRQPQINIQGLNQMNTGNYFQAPFVPSAPRNQLIRNDIIVMEDINFTHEPQWQSGPENIQIRLPDTDGNGVILYQQNLKTSNDNGEEINTKSDKSL